jgi:plastocyanin
MYRCRARITCWDRKPNWRAPRVRDRRSQARGARLLALAALLTLAAGACSGGGDGGGQSDAPAGTQPSATTAAGGSGSCPAGSGLSGNIADHGAAAATGSTLQIEAGDSFFAPTCETGVPTGTVTLVVRNTGKQLHNVSVPGQSIDTDVAPGQTITVKLKQGGKALPYFCKYHRTSGMWGSLLPQG